MALGRRRGSSDAGVRVRFVRRTYLALLAWPCLISAAPVAAQERIGDFSADADLVLTFGLNTETALAWRCDYGSASLVLVLDKYFVGENDRINVRYQFDDSAEGQFEQWFLEDNTRASNLLPTTFTRSALSADSVSLEAVDPLNDESTTLRFGLADLEGALRGLSCGRELLTAPETIGDFTIVTGTVTTKTMSRR